MPTSTPSIQASLPSKPSETWGGSIVVRWMGEEVVVWWWTGGLGAGQGSAIAHVYTDPSVPAG